MTAFFLCVCLMFAFTIIGFLAWGQTREVRRLADARDHDLARFSETVLGALDRLGVNTAPEITRPVFAPSPMPGGEPEAPTDDDVWDPSDRYLPDPRQYRETGIVVDSGLREPFGIPGLRDDSMSVN